MAKPKFVVAANFHVFVAKPAAKDGKPQNEARRVFSRGQVIEESDIPEGHTSKDWVAKGLLTAANAA